jgi:hypothetical protein
VLLGRWGPAAIAHPSASIAYVLSRGAGARNLDCPAWTTTSRCGGAEAIRSSEATPDISIRADREPPGQDQQETRLILDEASTSARPVPTSRGSDYEIWSRVRFPGWGPATRDARTFPSSSERHTRRDSRARTRGDKLARGRSFTERGSCRGSSGTGVAKGKVRGATRAERPISPNRSAPGAPGTSSSTSGRCGSAASISPFSGSPAGESRRSAGTGACSARGDVGPTKRLISGATAGSMRPRPSPGLGTSSA